MPCISTHRAVNSGFWGGPARRPELPAILWDGAGLAQQEDGKKKLHSTYIKLFHEFS